MTSSHGPSNMAPPTIMMYTQHTRIQILLQLIVHLFTGMPSIYSTCTFSIDNLTSSSITEGSFVYLTILKIYCIVAFLVSLMEIRVQYF